MFPDTSMYRLSTADWLGSVDMLLCEGVPKRSRVLSAKNTVLLAKHNRMAHSRTACLPCLSCRVLTVNKVKSFCAQNTVYFFRFQVNGVDAMYLCPCQDFPVCYKSAPTRFSQLWMKMVFLTVIVQWSSQVCRHAGSLDTANIAFSRSKNSICFMIFVHVFCVYHHFRSFESNSQPIKLILSDHSKWTSTWHFLGCVVIFVHVFVLITIFAALRQTPSK